MNTDIIVVGGGHAGIEAAYTASKTGLKVVLITIHVDMIGQMSCNPAIGGVAKGNIVREIDALGGAMGKIIDSATIQFRMLNKSKGLAVWGPRAQADKNIYRQEARKILESIENLYIYQGTVTEVLTKESKVIGVKTDTGVKINAKVVILTMGTFLNGLAHIGENTISCGRLGEPPSLNLSESIQKLGIKAGRLKTGTPARIDGRTVDFSKLKRQDGDEIIYPFSFASTQIPNNKLPCWILKTTQKTHEIIKKNIKKSALFSGKITSVGPRYCPSIEDKIVRFGDRDGHTLFLEPENIDNHEMYLNGFSTSFPIDIQIEMIKSLSGFENAEVIRPAYAIEYDYFYPEQLKRTLESKVVNGLFFAGQINGTSGYEEAACQGLVAGVNAMAQIQGEKPFILSRDSSYTGVLIDDLVVKGTLEPYRMFTSRAEYRLILRQDNVDERLMPIALNRKLISTSYFNSRKKIWKKRRALYKTLESKKIPVEKIPENTDKTKKALKAIDYLKRPGVSIYDVLKIINLPIDIDDVCLSVEADVKYEGFVKKQINEINRQKRMEDTELGDDFDYDVVNGLLNESRMKLKKLKPQTLGQASRISGVTPADISVLIMHLSNNI